MICHPGDVHSATSDIARPPRPLLSSLRIIARVKGITSIAAEIGMTRQGLQKALSAKGNPRLDNINAIMQAMGYHLLPQHLENLANPAANS
jgi:probable addiction module antidote protein